jgi:hypothetical protein
LSAAGKVVVKGVGIGDDIIMPLIPLRFGDLSDEIMEEVRDGVLDCGSSIERVEGRPFSAFLRMEDRCDDARGEESCNGAGGGISAILIPAALASSCSMT